LTVTKVIFVCDCGDFSDRRLFDENRTMRAISDDKALIAEQAMIQNQVVSSRDPNPFGTIVVRPQDARRQFWLAVLLIAGFAGVTGLNVLSTVH
jgi:hypothetical protein